MAIDFNDRLKWRKQELDYSGLSNAELCALSSIGRSMRHYNDAEEFLRHNWKLMAIEQAAEEEARRRIARGQFSLLRSFSYVGRLVYMAGETKNDATQERLELALIELEKIEWEYEVHRCEGCAVAHRTGRKLAKKPVQRKK